MGLLDELVKRALPQRIIKNDTASKGLTTFVNGMRSIVDPSSREASGEGFAFPPLNLAVLPKNADAEAVAHEQRHLNSTNPQQDYVNDFLWAAQDRFPKPNLPRQYSPLSPAVATDQQAATDPDLRDRLLTSYLRGNGDY